MDHPGKELERRISGLGLTRQDFASHLCVNNSQLSNLLNGRRDVNLGWSVRIGQALDCKPLVWVTKQLQYDLSVFERPSIKPLRKKNVNR